MPVNFDPPKITRFPPYNEILLIFFVLMAQKKGPDALSATQKTSALCKVPFLKKLSITAKNTHLKKTKTLLAVFLDFFRNGPLQRAEGFCNAFSAPQPFF